MESEKPQTERCWSGEKKRTDQKKVVSVEGKRVTTKQAQLDCVEEF